MSEASNSIIIPVVRFLQELGHAALSGDLLEVDAGAPGETLGSLCLFLPAGILLVNGFFNISILAKFASRYRSVLLMQGLIVE